MRTIERDYRNEMLAYNTVNVIDVEGVHGAEFDVNMGPMGGNNLKNLLSNVHLRLKPDPNLFYVPSSGFSIESSHKPSNIYLFLGQSGDYGGIYFKDARTPPKYELTPESCRELKKIIAQHYPNRFPKNK